MNELKIFENKEFGNLRVSESEGQPYVCLADLCKILEIKNVSDCKTRLNQDGIVSSYVIDSIGRRQKSIFINESNLYKVIFQSRKSEAEKFTEWVTSEVLPSIRKNGGYLVGQENLSEDEIMAKAILVANNKISELRSKNQDLINETQKQQQLLLELQPKADYLDNILKNKSIVPITYIAKDYGMSGIKMNQLLHELGVQYKMGQTWLLYQKYQAFGYTHSKITEIVRTNGRLDTKVNMEWTQKGRIFLYELLKKNGIVPTIEKENIV